jgi:MoxR-like ATPase
MPFYNGYDSQAQLVELERQIGVPSGSGIANVPEPDSKRELLKLWLTEHHGINQNSVWRTPTHNLVLAYCKPAYLAGWKRNEANGANGGKVKRHSELDLDLGNLVKALEANPKPEPEVPVTPIPPTPGSSAVTSLAESTVVRLFLPQAIQQELRSTKLEFSDETKQKVAELAANVARATIEALAPPRRVEIKHPSGSIVNVGLQHEKFDILVRALSARDHRGNRLNIWLTGPTGSGKTTAAENAAKALELPFASDGSLDADYKVLGFRDANGNVVGTEFLRVFASGGIYVADEIDNWLPSALLTLNAALANGWISTPSGMIQRNSDFACVACGNTWGQGATADYIGRTKLDAASLDRFQPKIYWPIDERLELAIATESGGTAGVSWCRQVQTYRARALNQGLKIIISPRATFSGIALLASGFSVSEITDLTVAAGLSPEQRKSLEIAGEAKAKAEARSETPRRHRVHLQA